MCFQLLGKTAEYGKETLEKNIGLGFLNMMSHEKFKAWAEEKKDDSLDILATVTLHLTNQADKETKWITDRLVKGQIVCILGNTIFDSVLGRERCPIKTHPTQL